MSISINSSKISFGETSNPPKRLKTEKELSPSKKILNDTTLTLRIIAYSTIAELGNFACVNKQSYASAQRAFIHKAQAMGFKVQDSSQAKFRIEKIYQYVWARGELKNTRFNSTEAAVSSLITRITHSKLPEILSFLINPLIYKDRHHPVLELLENENFWKNAAAHGKKLTLEEYKQGLRALRYAAYYERPKLVKLLLEHEINPDDFCEVSYPTNSTVNLPRPVELAILVGNFESVKHLLDHGADLNIKFSQGFQIDPETHTTTSGPSVLQCALGSKKARVYYPQARLNIPMLEFLLEKGVKITPQDMIEAVETCSIDLVQFLKGKGGEFNRQIVNQSFFHLVQLHIEMTHFETDELRDEMLAFLLNHGADINGYEWSIPLISACRARSLPWIQYLVAHRAAVNLTDENGVTPLMIATLTGSLPVVKFLLESGAEVNQRVIDDEDDNRPLYNALSYTCYTKEDNLDNYTTDSNSPELVKLLLSYGAKPTLESDNEEFSALFLARENGLTEIVKILEDHIASNFLTE